MAFSVTYTDPSQLSDRQLLLVILERLTVMSQQVDSEVAAEHELAGKVDLVLAALADGRAQNTALAAQIATLNALILQLQTDGVITAADADKLTAATAEMQAKSAAIDVALTPPVVTTP